MSDAYYRAEWQKEASDLASELVEHGDYAWEIFFPALFSRLRELALLEDYVMLSDQLILFLLADRGICASRSPIQSPTLPGSVSGEK